MIAVFLGGFECFWGFTGNGAFWVILGYFRFDWVLSCVIGVFWVFLVFFGYFGF